MKKLLLSCLVLLTMLTSCADSKKLQIDGKDVVVQPYGWFDTSEKNENVKYKVCAGNVVWSVLLCETVVAPILITGYQLWEPVSVKEPVK